MASDIFSWCFLILPEGLGNSAFETAARAQETAGYVHLLGRSRGGLRQAYQTHYVGDLRAVNNAVLDTFLLKSLDTVDVEFDLETSNCSFSKTAQVCLKTRHNVLSRRLKPSNSCAGENSIQLPTI